MLFNSFKFFLFFPLVCLGYFLLPQRWRWLLLLAGSYYFYMAWKPEYIILIIVSTLIDFFASSQMGKTESKEARKPWLWLSLFSNLGILLTFKYYGFFAGNIDHLFQVAGISYKLPISELILPMGISFYTFQTMAYSIDVYNGKIKHETHLGYFALYVSYFPQLVAGPIERAQNLLYQFRLKFDFEYGRAVSGLKQMLWGFFKKVVIADRVGVIVDMAYNSPGDYDGLALALATVLFAFQIYCDFSGYSDIAIGASKVLGIKLMDNFRTPYFSKDISEFWKRWHISLSTWFRDYLYIPLGGNRVVKWRWYYNLMIVFLVSGFWHGANWTFIIWGGLHGLYLVMAIVFEDVNKKLAQVIGLTKSKFLHKWVNIAITFALVLFAWIYFRANSATDGHLIVQKILSLSSGSEHSLILYIADGKVLITIALLGLFALSDSYIDSLIKQKRTLSRTPSLILYAAMMVIILIAGNFGEVNFLYFQF